MSRYSLQANILRQYILYIVQLQAIHLFNFQSNVLLICSPLTILESLVHISGHPASWIYDDIIILHPVIDFHGPNIVMNFHCNWFASFCTSLTYA